MASSSENFALRYFDIIASFLVGITGANHLRDSTITGFTSFRYGFPVRSEGWLSRLHGVSQSVGYESATVANPASSAEINSWTWSFVELIIRPVRMTLP